MKIGWPMLLLCCASIASCKKETNESRIRIEGFLLRDNYGQIIESIGNSDDDWTLNNWSVLSAQEQAFFNFPDTVGLANTSVASLEAVVAFPNPAAYVSTVSFSANDSVKVKVVLVDAGGLIHRSYAMKFKGTRHVSFDVSDRSLFPLGTSLRYYYSFSAEGNPNYKAGYGDIKICNVAPGTPARECF